MCSVELNALGSAKGNLISYARVASRLGEQEAYYTIFEGKKDIVL